MTGMLKTHLWKTEHFNFSFQLLSTGGSGRWTPPGQHQRWKTPALTGECITGNFLTLLKSVPGAEWPPANRWHSDQLPGLILRANGEGQCMKQGAEGSLGHDNASGAVPFQCTSPGFPRTRARLPPYAAPGDREVALPILRITLKKISGKVRKKITCIKLS